jgi:adenosylmethionine-8-amino-7-oxononanoate aminotransferase
VSDDDLYLWDRQHFWHSFTQMAEYESLVIDRAEGVWMIDIRGRRLLDGASSMWCNVHGHNHPVLNRAICDQLAKVAHTTSLGMGNSTTVRLARRLVELAPAGLEHVFFSSDGSSANEVALKAAFQYWRQCERPRPRKTKFLAFGEAYHGDTLGAASVGGIAKFQSVFEPLLFEVIRAPQPDARRQTTASECLAEVERLLAQHHDELAAVIVEPRLQGAAGMVLQPPGFVRGLRELATKFNVLMIADEVATGFGRTGTMWACEQEGIAPDLMTLGKGLTGGYLPMAATLATKEIWEAFLGDASSGRALYHGHTYSGNPTAAAVALASLDLFEQEQTLEKLPAKIEHLGRGLARLAESPHVAHPRQCGMMIAFDLVADKATGRPFAPQQGAGGKFAAAALQHGVWLRARSDMAYAMPPLSITHDEIDLLVAGLEAGLEALRNLPGGVESETSRAAPH